MAQNCPDCNSACLQKTPDACVVWTGTSIPGLGIKTGDYYNDAIVAFASKFIDLADGLIDVSSTNDGTCDNCSDTLPLFQAVQKMSNKLGNLKSSDITLDSKSTGLTDNSMSYDSGQLLNRAINYSVDNELTGSSIGVDLTNAITNLPLGYQLAKTSVVISGKRKFGSTVITDSSLSTFSVKVANDRYPIDMDVTIRVNTPSGTADLVSTIILDSPKVVNTTQVLSVKDRSKSAGESMSLSTFADVVSSQLRDNKSGLDQLNNIDIQGYSNIEFANTKLPNVMSVLTSKVSKTLSDLDSLSKINFDNNGSVVSGDTHTVTALIADSINSMKSDIQNIVSDIQNINLSLSSLTSTNITLLSQGGGATTGSTSGGSGGSSGGCPGGNCA